MSTRTYDQPYIVTSKGARQIEQALKQHSAQSKKQSSKVSIPLTLSEIVERYGK